MNSSSKDKKVDISNVTEQIVQSLYSLIEKKDFSKKPAAPSVVDMVEEHLNSHYEFRINPVLNRTEIRKLSETDFRLLDDRIFNSLFRELNLNKIKCTIPILRSILNSDFVATVDPFISYFKNLPKWKGDKDYIEELADTVKTTNQPFWKDALKRWLVAVVAGAVKEDKINHEVLVLSGEQGIGKTTWLRKLVPTPLKKYYFEGTINPDNKDTLIHLSENLFINLDELENLNKTELGSLKSLITQSDIKLRRPYGQFSENYIRRASFMGSVNDAEFLSDTTGNRRYLCFTVPGSDSINYKHELDMDKVYAQAYALLTRKGSFKYWFDTDDFELINENNSNYIRMSFEEEMVLKYFRKPFHGETPYLFTSSEIIQSINDACKSKVLDSSAVKRIGQAMSKHKFEKKSKDGRKPYKVILINQDKNQKPEIDKDSTPIQQQNNIPSKEKGMSNKDVNITETGEFLEYDLKNLQSPKENEEPAQEKVFMKSVLDKSAFDNFNNRVKGNPEPSVKDENPTNLVSKPEEKHDTKPVVEEKKPTEDKSLEDEEVTNTPGNLTSAPTNDSDEQKYDDDEPDDEPISEESEDIL